MQTIVTLGCFTIDKPLTNILYKFLQDFLRCQHIAKRVDNNKFGFQGEFSTNPEHENLYEPIKQASTQPSIYCQWRIHEDKQSIFCNDVLDESYVDWLVYILNKVLRPNGYNLIGTVVLKSSETDKIKTLEIKNNDVWVHSENTSRIHPVGMHLRLDFPYLDVKEEKKLSKKDLYIQELENKVKELMQENIKLRNDK